jgi:hypothetical protein
MAFQAERAGQPPPVRLPATRSRQRLISTIGLRRTGGIPQGLEAPGPPIGRPTGQEQPRARSDQPDGEERDRTHKSFSCRRKRLSLRAGPHLSVKIFAFLKGRALDFPWKFRKIKYSKEYVEDRQNSRSNLNPDGAVRLPAGGGLTGRQAGDVASQVRRQRSARY